MIHGLTDFRPRCPSDKAFTLQTLSRPIRVLQALSLSTLGGTEQMVLQLVSHMDRALFDGHVGFLDSTGPLVGRFQRLGVVVHKLDGRGGLPGIIWRLVRILQACRYDIVHLYGLRMSLIGRMAAHIVRSRPFIIHGIRGLHVTEDEEVSSCKTRFALAIERLGAPLVDAYVANSHGAVDFLCSRGLPRQKFHVVPNGIDVAQWHAPGARPSRDTPVIICVANFRPIKRHGDLVEALALLRGRGMKVRCLFVGDGPTRQAVESLAATRRLDGIVEFLGRCEPEEVKALLAQADIFVLPSLWEGLPGSVMEAMASGLPVVGTNVNGTNELVIDGETGFLAPPRTPKALAERLAWLVRDPQLRLEMGRRGRKRIAEEFTLDAMVKRTEDFYRSIVEARRPARQLPTNIT
jgi:glycosyltransferase involved in cell wall biosynthesis